MVGAIHPLIYQDLCSHKMYPRWGWKKLNDVSMDGDGIIIGNCSLKTAAQDIFKIQALRDRAPGWHLIRGWRGETPGVAGDEVVVEVLGSILF